MRPGKNSWYPQGSGNLPATLLPFRSSLFIVGRLKGGTPCCTNFLAYRASHGSARCFFSIGVSRNMHGRCRRDYGCIALRCRIRLTGQFTASNCRRAADGTSPRAGCAVCVPARLHCGGPVPGRAVFFVQCRLHIRDTRGNYVRKTRRSIGRARLRRTVVARRVGGGAPLWCAISPGRAWRGAKRGDYRGSPQGTFLATQSLRRSGMRNAGENDRWRKDR